MYKNMIKIIKGDLGLIISNYNNHYFCYFYYLIYNIYFTKINQFIFSI